MPIIIEDVSEEDVPKRLKRKISWWFLGPLLVSCGIVSIICISVYLDITKPWISIEVGDTFAKPQLGHETDPFIQPDEKIIILELRNGWARVQTYSKNYHGDIQVTEDSIEVQRIRNYYVRMR